LTFLYAVVFVMPLTVCPKYVQNKSVLNETSNTNSSAGLLVSMISDGKNRSESILSGEANG